MAMRRISLLTLLLGAGVAASCGLGAASGSSRTSSVTTRSPSGRTVVLTVRKGRGEASAWCAKVSVRGVRRVTHQHCDSGARHGLHGAFIADCKAHELIADGAVAPAVQVMQPRSGRGPSIAAHAPRPAGVRFAGDHYLIVVDLSEAHPRLVARRDGRTIARVDLADEAREC